MILPLRDPLTSAPVAIRLDWTDGDYSRGEVVAPQPLYGLRVGVWQRRVLLVPARTRYQKGWTKRREPTWDYARVEVEVIGNLGLVRWPWHLSHMRLELNHAAGICRLMEDDEDGEDDKAKWRDEAYPQRDPAAERRGRAAD